MRIRIQYALLLVSALWLLSCNRVVEPEEEFLVEPLIIRSGTSFGMCVGYCYTAMELTSQTTTLQKESFLQRDQYPDKQCSNVTNLENWHALKQTLNREALSQLPATIGCPDCADGGAEWIEVEEGQKKYRVTFEYNATIPEIQPLLDKIRQIRSEQRQNCQ